MTDDVHVLQMDAALVPGGGDAMRSGESESWLEVQDGDWLRARMALDRRRSADVAVRVSIAVGSDTAAAVRLLTKILGMLQDSIVVDPPAVIDERMLWRPCQGPGGSEK